MSQFIDESHIALQQEWSRKTFGPGARTQGLIEHIRKELLEIETDPTDISEWVDVIILALDGAWRSGHTPREIIYKYHEKIRINQQRTWPDWRQSDGTTAIEHIRES